jgi:hypothetical protein
MANPFGEHNRERTKMRAQIAGKLWPHVARRAIGGCGINDYER